MSRVHSQPLHTLWLATPSSIVATGTAPDALAQPVRRVIVPVLTDGRVPFKSQPLLFLQSKAATEADALPAFIEAAHAKGIQVYASIDCLRWVAPNTPEDEGIFAREPELAERELYGGYGEAHNGRFASPFNPRVRATLRDFVAEVATRYPQLDGLVLQCRLPLGQPLLGYSEAAREASQQALFLDPLDINLAGNEQDLQDTKRWVAWRLSETASLVAELAKTFRDKRPGGAIATVGFARWGLLKPGKQNTTLEDWPAWSKAGSMDEVLLQDSWAEVAPGTFAGARALVQGARRPVAASALVSSSQIATDIDLSRTVRALRAEGAAALPLVVSVESAADISRAARLWAALDQPADAQAVPVAPLAAATPKDKPALEVGQAAPDFEAMDMNGRRVRLSEFRGQKNVLLTFFPKCFTGGCEKHLESLQAHRAEFDAANTQIIAVSVDPAQTQRDFANTLGLSFSMLPDTGRRILPFYDALDAASGLARRQSILIDKSGVVRLIDRDVHVSTHGADLLDAMKKLQLQ